MPYKDPEKQKQAQHESYLRNKERICKKSKQQRNNRRQFMVDLKEKTPCQDCGNFFPHYKMDFDHREGVEKINTISRMVSLNGMKCLKEEIAKCDIVCGNCHRTRIFIKTIDKSEYSKAYGAVNQRKYRKIRRDFTSKIKESSPCTDCRQFYPFYVMEFDHLDRNTKSGNISKLIRSHNIEKLQQEIDKCEVVCTNCHRERTFFQQSCLHNKIPKKENND